MSAMKTELWYHLLSTLQLIQDCLFLVVESVAKETLTLCLEVLYHDVIYFRSIGVVAGEVTIHVQHGGIGSEL